MEISVVQLILGILLVFADVGFRMYKLGTKDLTIWQLLFWKDLNIPLRWLSFIQIPLWVVGVVIAMIMAMKIS